MFVLCIPVFSFLILFLSGAHATLGVRSSIKIWPARTVYYEFDPSLPKEGRVDVQQAMSSIDSHTCVRFVESSTAEHRVRIEQKNDDNCNVSDVGRAGGIQLLNLAEKCYDASIFTFGTSLHELLHVLGFAHEHQRPDRDEHVDILWKNIKAGKESNFMIKSWDDFQDLGLPYDFSSIMHYHSSGFGDPIGSTTIQTLSDPINNGDLLSTTDITAINRLYNCPKEGKKGKLTFKVYFGHLPSKSQNVKVIIWVYDRYGMFTKLETHTTNPINGNCFWNKEFATIHGDWQYYKVRVYDTVNYGALTLLQMYSIKGGSVVHCEKPQSCEYNVVFTVKFKPDKLKPVFTSG